MKKLFLLLCIVVITTALNARGLLDYPLSNTTNGLYETGESEESLTQISWGKHQNEAISPNYFDAIGIFFSDTKCSEYVNGTLDFNKNIDLSMLTPSVAFSNDDSFQNFKLRADSSIFFGFDIDPGVDKLSLKVGPYEKIDTLLGYYEGIDNILFQSFFALNLGVGAELEYKYFDTLRFGLGYTTFILGADYGRNGYNKDFLPEVPLSHFGNYLDMELTLYGTLDISRTESIQVEYNHSVFSVYDSNNTIISGENRIGISYIRKLVR